MNLFKNKITQKVFLSLALLLVKINSVQAQSSVVPDGLLNENPSFEHGASLPQGDFFKSILPKIISDLLILATTLALISFLYSGVSMIVFAENAEKVEAAKKNLFYSLIGLAIAGFAYSVVSGILILPF
jgi:hypothetical protein